MKRLFQTAFFILAIFILFPALMMAGEQNYNDFLPSFETAPCGILKQPNGPFAVMLFDEDALGLHIGVIYYDKMGNPADGNWRLSERFWCDNLWSSAVTRILWDTSGDYLYVSTSSVYGDGGVFKLNLRKKRAERVFPKPHYKGAFIESTEIIAFDRNLKRITVKVVLKDEKAKTVEIPMN